MGKRLTIALALFALIVVPLGAYVAGYFCLGERRVWYRGATPLTSQQIMGIERNYPQQWMKTAFRPAARMEWWLGGTEVQATWFLESMAR